MKRKAPNTTMSSTNAPHSDQKAKAARNERTRQNPLLIKPVILPPSFGTEGKESDVNLSAAEQLIKYLDRKRGEVSYVALYYEVKSTPLHTIKKADLRRVRKHEARSAAIETDGDDKSVPEEYAVIAECVDAAGNTTRTNAALSSKEQSEIGDVVCPVLKRLKVGQKILLAVAWVREDEKRLFELFPEVLMVDVTFGTNNEGRPLFVSAAFDKDMKSFTPLRAFLPSECRWGFRWIWGTAIPTLLGRDNLSRDQLVLSDGDAKFVARSAYLEPTIDFNEVGSSKFQFVSFDDVESQASRQHLPELQ